MTEMESRRYIRCVDNLVGKTIDKVVADTGDIILLLFSDGTFTMIKSGYEYDITCIEIEEVERVSDWDLVKLDVISEHEYKLREKLLNEASERRQVEWEKSQYFKFKEKYGGEM